MARWQTIFWRVVLTLIFLILTLAGVAFLYPQQFLTIDSGETKADALVVLGGDDGRAQRAAELYRQGVAPIVLVTGFGDCDLNILKLEQNGVPASIIIPEPRALTTMQNAELSVPMLRQHGVHRVILVTSWFHSRRALAVFEHVAPDLQFYSRPCYLDFQPKDSRRTGFEPHVNIEYAKIIDYIFEHGVLPF